MRIKNVNKKLLLRKWTVANLSIDEMLFVKGRALGRNLRGNVDPQESDPSYCAECDGGSGETTTAPTQNPICDSENIECDHNYQTLLCPSAAAICK